LVLCLFEFYLFSKLFYYLNALLFNIFLVLKLFFFKLILYYIQNRLVLGNYQFFKAPFILLLHKFIRIGIEDKHMIIYSNSYLITALESMAFVVFLLWVFESHNVIRILNCLIYGIISNLFTLIWLLRWIDLFQLFLNPA